MRICLSLRTLHKEANKSLYSNQQQLIFLDFGGKFGGNQRSIATNIIQYLQNLETLLACVIILVPSGLLLSLCVLIKLVSANSFIMNIQNCGQTLSKHISAYAKKIYRNLPQTCIMDTSPKRRKTSHVPQEVCLCSSL